MKKPIYILLFLLTGLLYGQQRKTLSVDGLTASKLVILGSSNVNTFSCTFDTDYLNSCREITVTEKGQTMHFENAILALKTKGFDCGSRPINKDFKKLLKTDDYPEITLQLLRAEQTPTKIIATVAIRLAGKIKEYEVVVNTQEQERYSGKLLLKLSDYDLSQPKKLFGLIEVHDEIAISFDIAATTMTTEAYYSLKEN